MAGLNDAFKGPQSGGGCFDQEQKENPLTFDSRGEPIDVPPPRSETKFENPYNR